MYVSEFICGAVTVILMEVAAVIGCAIYKSIKRKR